MAKTCHPRHRSSFMHLCMVGMLAAMTVMSGAVSCRSQGPQASGGRVQTAGWADEGRLLFVTATLVRDTMAHTCRVHIDQQDWAKGRANLLDSPAGRTGTDRLQYVLTDEAGMELARYGLGDPLSRSMEIADDEGRLSRVLIKTDSAQFSLRVQVEPDMRMLRIYYDQTELKLIPINPLNQ